MGHKIYIIHFPPLVPIFPPTGPSTNYISHSFWSPLPKFPLLLWSPISLHNRLLFFHTQANYFFFLSLHPIIIYFLCPHSPISLSSSGSRLSPLPNIHTRAIFFPQPKLVTLSFDHFILFRDCTRIN